MTATNTQADGSGTTSWLHGNTDGEIIDAWHPSLQVEEAANDSDKSFTVTASEEWRIQSIWVELTSTATAGNRQLVIELQDSSNDVIAQVRAGVTQAASLTYYYLFAPNVVDLTAVRDTDFVSTTMPSWVLAAGYIIRIYDNNAVDAAADDMVVQINTIERSVP